MSSIYFHNEHGDAHVSGSERASFGMTCANIAWGVLDIVADDWSHHEAKLRDVFPVGHYVLSGPNFACAAEAFFCVGSDPILFLGKELDPFTINLNTAYYMGSDEVKLAARLHGQCEIHAYVEGANKQWLADIIKRGRSFKFFRDGMGWDSAISLLEKEAITPVVTSYSVCDQFPNSGIANFDYPILPDGEENYDAWYDLPPLEQWEMAMIGLRESGRSLELSPDNWDEFYFADGTDANMIVHKLTNERSK